MNNVKPANPQTKGKLIGQAFLGVVSLCGIACSLPLLVSGLAIGSTTIWSFLSLTWPVALVLLGLMLGVSWFLLAVWRNRSKSRQLRATNTGFAITDPGPTAIPIEGSNCSADGSCGCKS